MHALALIVILAASLCKHSGVDVLCAAFLGVCYCLARIACMAFSSYVLSLSFVLSYSAMILVMGQAGCCCFELMSILALVPSHINAHSLTLLWYQ